MTLSFTTFTDDSHTPPDAQRRLERLRDSMNGSGSPTYRLQGDIRALRQMLQVLGEVSETAEKLDLIQRYYLPAAVDIISRNGLVTGDKDAGTLATWPRDPKKPKQVLTEDQVAAIQANTDPIELGKWQAEQVRGFEKALEALKQVSAFARLGEKIGTMQALSHMVIDSYRLVQQECSLEAAQASLNGSPQKVSRGI